MKTLWLFLALFAGLAVPVGLAADVSELTGADMTRQGIAAYNRGDYNSAIRLLSARARMAPADPNVFYYLGHCYMHNKQSGPAASMFAACIRIAPNSQAGKYAISALEHLSSAPGSNGSESSPHNKKPDPAAVAAAKDSLMSEKPLDKSFNDAVARIRSQRQSLKNKIDHIWAEMQDDIQAMGSKSTVNAAELEGLQREAENKVQDAQTRQLRWENRLLAPEKIDVRPMPQLPQEKPDDSKIALGSLLAHFKAEQPFDPFATDITPEVTSKFLSIYDVFGELSTYQPSERRVAKQAFMQLKSSIEGKQNILDQDIYNLKATLIRDLVQANTNYGAQGYNKWKVVNPSAFIAAAKIPRMDQNNLTPAELEMSQVVQRAKRRIEQVSENYHQDVEHLIAGAKERVHGMVAQTGQLNKQLQNPSGTIQLVPHGTDLYTRNYVNFGDRPELDSPVAQPAKHAKPAKPAHAKQTKATGRQGSK